MSLAGKPNFANRYAVLNRARQRKRFMLIGVAALSVILLTSLVMSFNTTKATADKATDLNSMQQTESIQAVTSRNVIVPSRDIQVGELIQSEDLEQVVISKDAVSPEAITDKSEAIGTYATINLKKGEYIKKGNFSLDGQKREALNITPGMRAITVEVDARRGIEGWALPGTRVDVVLTYMHEGELTSKIVVENTRVLSNAGDSRTDKNQEDRLAPRQIAGKSTVTLETTPKDALKIETAQQKGSLSLHMRSQDDTKTSGVESFSENDFEKEDNDKEVKKNNKKERCTKGKMKIDGQEYVVDCNGQVIKD